MCNCLPAGLRSCAMVKEINCRLNDTAVIYLIRMMTSKMQSHDQLSRSKTDDFTNTIWYGPLKPHWKTGYEVVFISTYFLTYGPLMYTVVARLPDLGGRQRYVHIENPNYDAGSNRKSLPPYTIRPHPIVNGAAKKMLNRVSLAVSNGDNGGMSVHLKHSGDEPVSSHGGTFSPNNMHLGGLPTRVLKDAESFGFVTHIDSAKQGIKVDTFHLLIGDPEPIVKIGWKCDLFEEFIRDLVAYSKTRDDCFQHNTNKLVAFCDGDAKIPVPRQQISPKQQSLTEAESVKQASAEIDEINVPVLGQKKSKKLQNSTEVESMKHASEDIDATTSSDRNGCDATIAEKLEIDEEGTMSILSALEDQPVVELVRTTRYYVFSVRGK